MQQNYHTEIKNTMCSKIRTQKLASPTKLTEIATERTQLGREQQFIKGHLNSSDPLVTHEIPHRARHKLTEAN